MMRLWSRTGAVALSDPESGQQYEIDSCGGFEFPEPLGQRLYGFHVGGVQAWETRDERIDRLIGELPGRRDDPEALSGVVLELAALVVP